MQHICAISVEGIEEKKMCKIIKFGKVVQEKVFKEKVNTQGMKQNG